jgi:hypothetical protein
MAECRGSLNCSTQMQERLSVKRQLQSAFKEAEVKESPHDLCHRNQRSFALLDKPNLQHVPEWVTLYSAILATRVNLEKIA